MPHNDGLWCWKALGRLQRTPVVPVGDTHGEWREDTSDRTAPLRWPFPSAGTRHDSPTGPQNELWQWLFHCLGVLRKNGT